MVGFFGVSPVFAGGEAAENAIRAKMMSKAVGKTDGEFMDIWKVS